MTNRIVNRWRSRLSQAIANWRRSREFGAALKKGNNYQARQLLEEIRSAGARLSPLERGFLEKIRSDQQAAEYEIEAIVLREQISEASRTLEERLLEQRREFEQVFGQQKQTTASIRQELEEAREDIAALSRQLSEVSTQKQTVDQIIELKDQLAASTQQQLDDLSTEKRQAERAIAEREQEIELLRRQIDDLSTEKQQDEGAIAEREQEIESLRRQIDDLSTEKQQDEGAIAELGEEIASLRRQLEETTIEKEQGEGAIAELGEQIESLRKQLEETEITKRKYAKVLKQRLQQVDNLSTEKQQADQLLAEREQQIEDLRGEIRDASALFEAEKQEYEKLIEQRQQEAAAATQQLQERTQEIEELRRQRDRKSEEVTINVQQIEALRRQLEDKEQQGENLLRDKQQTDQTLETVRQERESLNRQLSEALAEKQRLEQLLARKQQTVYDLSRNKERAEQESEQLRQEIEARERQLRQKEQEAIVARQQLEESSQEAEELRRKLSSENLRLTPNAKFIEYISNSFNLRQPDENMLQCTGIDKRVFDNFEANLAKFLKEEFRRISSKEGFASSLEKAINDLNSLKTGQDPEYNFELSPHVYLMRYFLDHVYGAYLAWFLIYKAGLLPAKVNILDIAAGPGTVAYGLALLLQSSADFFPIPPMHVSYYSLEQQKAFQDRGLQFWRKYIEPQQNATNAYFRFDTSSIFDYENQSGRIPQDFFDFIAICHGFFSDRERRTKSQGIFKEVFARSLKETGYVLLIIQDKKLFIPYGVRQSENRVQEESVIRRFVDELGLNLVWYKYLTSAGKREPIPDYGRFARENLPSQTSMNPMVRQYLRLNFDLCYTVDDYVILAKR